MAESEILVRLCNKTDTRINWETNNPILKCGEIGYDTDTKQIKIGDGINTWSNLDYIPLSSDLILSKEASGTNIYTENGAQNVSPIDLKIYGNSQQTVNKGKNLIPYPYAESTKETNGITFTVNTDGSIIANGTATGNLAQLFLISTSNKVFIENKTYFLSGCPADGSTTTYYLEALLYKSDGTYESKQDIGNGIALDLRNGDYESIALKIVIQTGTTVSNISFSPQLEIGTAATTYEKYSTTPSIYLPSEIQSIGKLVTSKTSPYYGKYDVAITIPSKNIVSYPYNNMSYSGSSEGITWTINNDGTIIMNGTATKNVAWEIEKNIILKKGITYSFSGTKGKGSSSSYSYSIKGIRLDNNEKYNIYYNDSYKAFTPPSDIMVSIMFMFYSGYTANNFIIKPQIEIGSEITEYEPGINITKHIYLNEPLRKIDDYADYVDWGNQEVVRQIGISTINFSFYKYESNIKGLYLKAIINNTLPNTLSCMSNKIKSFAAFPGGADTNRLLVASRTFYYFVSAEESEQQDYIDKMQNVIICYPLETPTIENIENIDIKTSISDNLNIFVQSDIQPSNIYVKYYTKQYQDIANHIANIKNSKIDEYTFHNTLSNYQTKLTFDSTPTSSSTNPVTSGGIKTALDSKLNRTELYEARLKWGGKDISGDVSPISAAAGDQFRANRLAFLDKQYFDIEYSNDAGETWTGYEITQDEINNLIINNYSNFQIGGPNITKGSTNDMLRITITAPMNILYCQIKKILVRVSTHGAAGSYMKIEAAKIGTETEFAAIPNMASQINVSGWSGWNELNGNITFGGSNGQTNNYRKLRLTFGCTGVNTNYTSILTILGLRIFAPTYWSAPSDLAKTDHLYAIDNSGIATFPNDIKIKGSLTLGIQSSLPVASSTNRGKIIIIESKEEGDTLYVCLKGINNTYYWQALPKANDTISIE